MQARPRAAPLPVGETGGSKGQGEGRGGGSPGLHKPKARKAGETPPLGLKAAPLPARGAKPLSQKWPVRANAFRPQTRRGGGNAAAAPNPRKGASPQGRDCFKQARGAAPCAASSTRPAGTAGSPKGGKSYETVGKKKLRALSGCRETDMSPGQDG